MEFDFLIRGGLVFEGTGADAIPGKTDVGIKDDFIKAVGNLSQCAADRVVNAEGLYVCPGFIDVHSHSEFTLLADGRAEGKVCQGITTEINGNCGLSAAPLYGHALEQRAHDMKELNITDRWNTFSEYFAALNKKRFAVNFATLVGHGNLRASVVGYTDREPTREEQGKMVNLLIDAICSGAKGLSTGLVYPPGVYSKTSEIILLVKEMVKHSQGIYTTHMRSEGSELIGAVEEVLRIGFDAGARVHISHLKTSGEKNWGKIEMVIEKIAAARQRGLKITCDRYPYTAGSTDLDSVLPSWVYEEGHASELDRLKYERERIFQELISAYPDKSYWENILVSAVNSGQNKWMEGKSIAVIAGILKKDTVKCLIDTLVEENLRVGAIFFSMSEDNLETILKLPFTMIGSDSSARSFDGVTARGKPHPRGFGTFPRVLGEYVRGRGIISLNEALYKMTGLPAGTFGLKNRGNITEGFSADITIFAPDSIKDNATFESPFLKPDGIHYVFVNGEPVLWEGRLTGAMPGRILK